MQASCTHACGARAVYLSSCLGRAVRADTRHGMEAAAATTAEIGAAKHFTLRGPAAGDEHKQHKQQVLRLHGNVNSQHVGVVDAGSAKMTCMRVYVGR